MTIAAAVRVGSVTHLCADRMLSGGGCGSVGPSKIRAVGPYTIVSAGYFAAIQALAGRPSRLPSPPPPSQLRGWLEAELIPAMKAALRAAHTRLDGDLLVVVPGCAPVVLEGWQWTMLTPAMVGSGGEAALAAWHALSDYEPAERLRRACKAACKVRTDCGGQVDYLALE